MASFAHELAGHGETRAIPGEDGQTLVVFDPRQRAVAKATVVAAEVNGQRRYTWGALDAPAPGWTALGGTVYPEDRVHVLGAVLFTVTVGGAA